MKIGLLTFTENTNIGQRLQNYALQHTLEEMGHTVETIRQDYPFNKMKRFIKQSIFKVKHPATAVRKFKRQRKFDDFNKKNIHFYKKKISFHNSNTYLKDEFDSFIVGSDQVWSPVSSDVGHNYFLTFADRHQRMTYAPSISVEEMPEGKVELYKKYLSGFDTITVREDRGADIVEELTGKRPEVVLDPTLLLNRRKWDDIKENYYDIPEEPYAVSMFLGASHQKDFKPVCEKLGLKLLDITSLTEISPSEFISVIEKSSLVGTDSYHVTIFSTIYQRPFINFQRSNGARANSRFLTLYRLLGIKNRTWDYLKDNQSEITEMDYSSVVDNKIHQQKLSLDILKAQIDSTLENSEKKLK